MKTDRKRENGKVRKVVGKMLVVFLVVFLAGTLLLPDQNQAEKARSTAEIPDLTWASFWDGSFLKGWEAYYADRLFGRGLLGSLVAAEDTVTGHREENGIYKGSQDQLLEEIKAPDEEKLNKNLQAIWDFASQYWEAPMSIMIVPDAAQIFPDRLPVSAKTLDQSELTKTIDAKLGELVLSIDAESALKKHVNEKLYYQTDYHWTSLGAYYAFQEAAKDLELDTSKIEEFASYAVTTEYNGALSARSGFLKGVKEEIQIYIPGEKVQVVVEYPEKKEKRTSLFSSAGLESEDPYRVFLGGDDPLVDIKTTADSNRRLLVFKDSSANCFVQFLTPYYREIILVDPTSCNMSGKELMETYHATDVMFLYRGNVFAKDDSLSGVLTGE